MKPTLFIHTNSHEILSAKVAMYSHLRASKNLDNFDIVLIRLEDYPHLMKRHGQSLIRFGKEAAWYNNVPQSFLPLRFMVPQLMNYEGRAVLTDPDIFAVADVYELIACEMQGKSILSRPIGAGEYNSSVMLLDCEKLKHWDWNQLIDKLFLGQIDLQDYIYLRVEPKNTIGELKEEYNHYDKLNVGTKLLHNTNQRTQPWKTGLPYKTENLNNHKKTWKDTLRRFKYTLQRKESPKYMKHPDQKQEALFFSLMKEAIATGFISDDLIESEIKLKHIRPDVYSLMNSLTCSVDDILGSLK